MANAGARVVAYRTSRTSVGLAGILDPTQCLVRWRAIDAPRHDRQIGFRVTKHFGYAIDRRYLPVLLACALRPARDGVTLTEEGSLLATFGFFKIATPLSNVAGAHITRNYRWWTAVGIRLSGADDGLTLGTNLVGCVCMQSTEKVPSPLRRRGHSALTVTVADLVGLTTALGGDTGEPGTPPA